MAAADLALWMALLPDDEIADLKEQLPLLRLMESLGPP